ncbi:hypothetical protein ACFWSF_40600 [Streptomyces sp. NPDC058611]|uniref:hypothetical protein n=1 Tax=Streptomyces sp. NPDC058611 TaxID=3346554 RepID=UPI003650D77F
MSRYTYEEMARTPGLAQSQGIPVELPDVAATLSRALDTNANSVMEATFSEGVLDVWAMATSETRAALLLSLAWGAREYGVYEGQVDGGADDPAYVKAQALWTYAHEHPGTSEEFLGGAFPAMPLPGRAGAQASEMGFDLEEEALHESAAAALLLLAPVRQATLDRAAGRD